MPEGTSNSRRSIHYTTVKQFAEFYLRIISVILRFSQIPNTNRNFHGQIWSLLHKSTKHVHLKIFFEVIVYRLTISNETIFFIWTKIFVYHFQFIVMHVVSTGPEGTFNYRR